MASSKSDSIRLSTYDELFSSPPKPQKGALKKLRSLKRRSVQAGKGSELFAALQKQRVVVDERAIHFVAEARAGKRADARNSVFKLAQRYQVLPDREHVQRIKQLYGKVRENEDSGDEEWDKASSKLPGKLDKDAFLKLVQKDSDHQHLLTEMEEINQETADLADDIVTHEELKESSAVQELDMILEEEEKKSDSEEGKPQERPPVGSEEESDVEFDDEDLKIALGKESKEFAALEELVKSHKESEEFNPKGTVCCVVTLPKNRSLSLVFLDEDNRNGFVFFLRVLIKKAKAAVQQLEKQGNK
ncbi:hypothetical protein Emag_004938 [Eimeria magna]